LSHRVWQDLSGSDFAAPDPAQAAGVRPLAAIELHGRHLPVQV